MSISECQAVKQSFMSNKNDEIFFFRVFQALSLKTIGYNLSCILSNATKQNVFLSISDTPLISQAGVRNVLSSVP